MVRVEAIKGKKQIKRFTQFKNRLYRGHKYAVPTLERGEMATLDPERNPAMEFCDMQCFLAYNEKGKIVGRICAMINHKSNEKMKQRYGRFGFFDFIEDIEVARALLLAAEDWVRERDMTAIQGPLGFTNMDEEGVLIEGFEELGTQNALYNYPYYGEFMDALGYEKEADWIEMLIDLPSEVPPRFVKFSKIVKERYGLQSLKPRSTKEMIEKGWAQEFFELVNREYDKLYGYTAMTERQIARYIEMYASVIQLDLICLVADSKGKIIGCGISFPSLSRALQKARGRMLPFGWYHLMKALRSKHNEIIDLTLIAVDSEYQNKGVTSIIMNDIIEGMVSRGARYAETNPELETNSTIHSQWDVFTKRQHKRRRSYTKEL